MTLRAQPPLADWPIASLGDRPTIATGHQPYLWHPGILSKYLAADAVAQRVDGQTLNVVVDQDVLEGIDLALPVRDGDRLDVHHVRLGALQPLVPLGAQPPIDAGEAAAALRDVPDSVTVSIKPVLAAFNDLPKCRTVAEQMAVVLDRLLDRWITPPRRMLASELVTSNHGRAIVEAMREQASPCATAYNNAVADVPEAGLTPLAISRERVEMPLWWVRWNRPRQRAYVDVADSEPTWVGEGGEPIDFDRGWLAPRAMLLTALMRSGVCDLFIHGTGGGAYDRATEQWWHAWRNEPLNPKTVVTADLHLPFSAPLATPQEHDRAVWFAHHLPHNLDRYHEVDPDLKRRKREALAHMDDDRDPDRRAELFDRIHRINDALVARHQPCVQRSEHRVREAEVGLTNRAIAQRRDWCFTLYPDDAIETLHREIERGLSESATPTPAD